MARLVFATQATRASIVSTLIVALLRTTATATVSASTTERRMFALVVRRMQATTAQTKLPVCRTPYDNFRRMCVRLRAHRGRRKLLEL